MEAFRRASRNGLLALSLALLGAGPALAQDFVSIGTASPAGAYYPLGVAMADLWNRNVPGVRFSAQETGGGRSEERRVGKEGAARGPRSGLRKKRSYESCAWPRTSR